MKSTAPWGENLLRHCCVTDDLEQEVLGDLFQDWNIHIQQVGLWRANIRYLRQAMSLIPHLLHCWVRRVNRFEAVKTVGFVVALFAIVWYWAEFKHSFTLWIINFGLNMMSASEPGPNINPLTVDWVGIALSISAISTLWAFGAGIVVGALSGRASMIAVIWLSLMWAVAAPIYVFFWMPDEWPSWYVVTYPLCMVSGTIAGGCIGVLLRARFLTWVKRGVKLEWHFLKRK